MTRDSIYKQFVTQIGLVGLLNVIQAGKNLILMPILSKMLSPTDYGIWVQIIITVGILALISSLGLGDAVIRFLARYEQPETRSVGYWSIVAVVAVISAGLSLGVYGGAAWLAMVAVGQPTAATLFRIAAPLVIIETILTINLTYFRALGQMGVYVGFSAARDIGEVTLAGLLVLAGFGLWGAVIGMLVTRFLVWLGSMAVIITQIGFHRPSQHHAGQYLVFSLPLLGSTLFDWVVNSSDRYILAALVGVAAVGAYSVGYTLSYVLVVAVAPLGNVLFPTLSSLWGQGRMAEVETVLNYSTKYHLLLSIPGVVGLTVLAKPLLLLISTSAYLEGALVIPWVACGYVLYSLFGFGYYVLVQVDQTRRIALLLGGAALFNLVVTFALVSRLGMSGAAIASFLTYALLALGIIRLARRYVHWSIDLWFIAKSLTSALIMGLLIRVFAPQSLLAVIVAVVAGGGLYFALIILMRGLRQAEFAFLGSVLRSWLAGKANFA